MSQNFKSYIYVTFQKEGIHCYPAALEDPKLKDVSFLGHPHRHMFHFKAQIEVFHDDRDIEFILLKRELEGLFEHGVMEIDHKSCEMLARDVLEYLKDKYPGRQILVEVSEDNENGALLAFGGQ